MATTTELYTTDFANSKDTYQAALISLFSGKPEDTQADLSKLCTPTFTFKADKTEMDFPGFVAHMRHLREILPSVTLTITQFLCDGPQRAERHIGTMITSNETVLRSETFQFAQIAEDGRFEWIVETVQRFD
ncbi:hypothetical protein DTO021D3_4892 [Paecilomyces variotii]|nr:hypothetical protein DTO032I3_1691 [Paecilomyces variotii]KAJ9278158.1 hypothetical protein DTO021D3_4892 [Paecilomyces variotii]KAJ9345522.1 hypothetical protein DTO027B6_2053 [Paecilomyces variotii]KAJ9381594.1 hypothetical protein DTO032I4_6157 [Paecilomyces variotii]